MKKLIGYRSYIVIMIIGILDLCCGIYFQLSYDAKLERYERTEARIYAINKRDDHKEVLYFHFYVGDQEYDGVFVSPLKYQLEDKLEIYYHPDHPVDFILPDSKKNFKFMQSLGIGILFLGIFLCIHLTLKKKKILSKMNGV